MRKILLTLTGSKWESILRVLCSLALGGLFYFIWMAAFLFLSSFNALLDAFLWLMAPILTGLGFALGIVVFDRLVKVQGGPFGSILLWPLIGCVLGAASVYWFGPMLIVFSMLTIGTLSVSLREIITPRLATN